MRSLCLSYTLLLVSVQLVSAQRKQTIPTVRYTVEVGGLTATPTQTPFWLTANQYGIVPSRGSFGTLRVGAQRNYPSESDSTRQKSSRFKWGFGLFATANTGTPVAENSTTFVVPDAYVKVKFGQFELYAGNRREVFGLGDTVLTSGFIAWSGNANPFPKVQLYTPGFVPLKFTKNLLAFRAGYAHGWFTNTYIQGSYLHQKYLYGRLGKPNWKIRLYAGLNHQVQWGGRADYLVGTNLAINGTLPTAFSDYVSLVTGRYPDAIQNNRFTGFDGENRVGNHVGSYDFGLEWRGEVSNWFLYHQHIYDDASGLAFQNIPDGLTGLRFINQKPIGAAFHIERMVVEWVNTTNQSGPIFDQTLRYQGRDNYFNNSQYIQGWSYRGRTIGTPFIAPHTDYSSTANEFIGGGFFPNNRIVAWYAGASGVFRHGAVLTLRASYSRNFGSFNQPYPQPFHQFSTLLTTQLPLVKWWGTVLVASVALDRGEFLPRSTGSYIGLRKSW